MRQASWTRSIRARIFGFSFFNQNRSICSAITRSTLQSTRFAPVGVPRSDDNRLDAFRVARKRLIMRYTVDRLTPNASRAASTTSRVPFHPEAFSRRRRKRSRRSASCQRGLFGASMELAGVPRFCAPRLEARRVFKKRDARRNKVDLGMPSSARAARTTSAVTFQLDRRSS